MSIYGREFINERMVRNNNNNNNYWLHTVAVCSMHA